MKQKVENSDGMITIFWYDSDNDEFDYEFSLDKLEEHIVVKDPREILPPVKYSRMIHHLLAKKWIEKETLYQLGQLTVENFPENEIEWLETFKLVERHFYQKALDQHEEENDSNLSDKDAFVARMERNREERDKDEVEDGLEEVAKELLKKWKVIKN